MARTEIVDEVGHYPAHDHRSNQLRRSQAVEQESWIWRWHAASYIALESHRVVARCSLHVQRMDGDGALK
jgi:hypothetical protein